MTVTSCGHTRTYAKAPTRVVSGWPTTVDTLNALGVGKSVIGYTAGKFGPAPVSATAKKLTDDYAPAAEAILVAKPDFFVANGDSQLSGSRGSITVDDLSQAGAGEYVMGHDCKGFNGAASAGTVYNDIKNLGAIFGVPQNAAALNRKLRARVAAARALRGKAKAPRVAYVSIFGDQLSALSGLSYAAQVSAVGAVNVFANLHAAFTDITPEKVLTLNPDAIVYEWFPFQETSATPRAAIAKLLANSKAVKNGKMIGVPIYLSEGPGIATIRAIEMVAKGLYGSKK